MRRAGVYSGLLRQGVNGLPDIPRVANHVRCGAGCHYTLQIADIRGCPAARIQFGMQSEVGFFPIRAWLALEPMAESEPYARAPGVLIGLQLVPPVALQLGRKACRRTSVLQQGGILGLGELGLVG